MIARKATHLCRARPRQCLANRSLARLPQHTLAAQVELRKPAVRRQERARKRVASHLTDDRTREVEDLQAGIGRDECRNHHRIEVV